MNHERRLGPPRPASRSRRFAVRGPPEGLRTRSARALRPASCTGGVGAPRPVLCASLGALEWPSGGALRPSRAQVLPLRSHALPAGFLPAHLAADDRGALALLLHGARRPPVVWLCLSTDGVDRDLRVDGKTGRGQPLAADEARSRALVARQARA